MGQGALIGGSIIIAGIVIAGAIIFTQMPRENTQANRDTAPQDVDVAPVSEADHLLGDRNAPVTIIEYSDFECPFCSRAHPTVERVVESFDGQVAWVYRHFPLDQIHPQATPAAIASECIAELGGNDAFWQAAQALFDAQSQLGEETYVRIAQEVGVERDAFASCLASNEYGAIVTQQRNDAIAAGGRGTPFFVLVGPDGESRAVSGALPYEQFESAVNQLLN